MRYSQQQGAALIIVLFIVAVTSILATEMGARLQLQTQRIINLKDNNQAYWYGVGAEAYAKLTIGQLYQLDDGIIHAQQPWVDPIALPIDGGIIDAQLADGQTCFNLNSLLSQNESSSQAAKQRPEAQALQRLLTLLAIDNFTAETIVDSLLDFIDADDQPQPFGAEDNSYLAKPFPHLASNQPLQDISQLRLVNGITPQILQTIAPYVCVLPEQKLRVNVNSLTEEQAILLAALVNIQQDAAARIISQRPAQGYRSNEALLAERAFASESLSAEQRLWFTTTTEYFTLSTKTTYNEAQFRIWSLLATHDHNNIQIIARRFGSQL